ncbi:MAG: hypothetical protein WCE30_07880 [Mycobacterium sp.]
MAAMLALDNTQVEPSYAWKPFDADDSWCPDKTLYPNAYTDGGRVIHTRFAAGRGTRFFIDESMYGHWVPGDACAALLARRRRWDDYRAFTEAQRSQAEQWAKDHGGTIDDSRSSRHGFARGESGARVGRRWPPPWPATVPADAQVAT